MKIFNKIKIGTDREIQFLNFPFIQYGTKKKNNIIKKYIKIFPKSLEYKIIDRLIKLTKNKHDLIFFIRAGMGEAYLLNFMIDELSTKYKAQNVCFVCPRKTYADLFKLYSPNIPFYHLDDDNRIISQISQTLTKQIYISSDCIINVNPFPLKYLQQLLSLYEENKEQKHYAKIIKSFNQISKFKFRKIQFNQNIKEIINKKIQNLNIEKFIFIVKDANFTINLSDVYWNKLIDSLKNKNYDIFINSLDYTIPQAIYIASKAKGIIGLRCGFMEVLSTLDVPKYIIYTACKHNDIKEMEKLFTLKQYPFVNKNTIHEYDALSNDIESITNKILGEL